MRLYSDNVARMIDPAYSTLADILKAEAGDQVDDYDIDEGAKQYIKKLDYELEPLGLFVADDGKVYVYDDITPDDELVESTIQGIDIDEILDSVDITITNSWGYSFHPYQWPAIVQMMDDDIREDMADDDTYNTNQKFFTEYAKRHLAKFGEEWELDKANPVW